MDGNADEDRRHGVHRSGLADAGQCCRFQGHPRIGDLAVVPVPSLAADPGSRTR